MQFVRIAPGEFMMGSPASEAGRLAGETQHQVRLTHPFLLGAHLVTRGQFAQFVREASYQSDAEKEGSAIELVGRAVRQVKGASWKKPGFEQTNLDPVVSVSWNDAQAFCAWLSKKEEKEKRTYRLPTEAQWEYACRAGAATAYPWGNDIDGGQGFCNIADKTLQAKFPDVAAIDWSDGFMHTSPVGTFRPNAWGLYDMVGNALEWCEDWMGPYPTGHVVDPKGPALGTFRILRGGSWSDAPALCRSAQRFERPQDYRSAVTGFRCLLDVP
jgi:formylglycine-generating enzyme required for sulfatase activity